MKKNEKSVTVNALKIKVFDIQQSMQLLLTQIQPVQEEIQELDKKRLELTAKIMNTK